MQRYSSVPPASSAAQLAHPAPALELSSSHLPTPPCWGASSCGVLVLVGHISMYLLWDSSEEVAEALFLCRVVHLRPQESKKPRSFYSRPRPPIVSFSSRSGCERQDAIIDTLTRCTALRFTALHCTALAVSGPELGPSSDRLISDIPT